MNASMPGKCIVPACCAAALLLVAGAYAAVEPAHYSTPDEAVQALIDAAASQERNALVNVLGSEVEELRSGDVVADAAERQDFVDAATVSARIEQDDENHAVLTIGPDDWPFPIPLQRDAEGWRFNVAAGKEELLNRRIGLNELFTIEVMRAYVDAQYEYAEEDRNDDGVREYAPKMLSSKGARDGLYWPTQEGEPESPMGPLVAEAAAEGYRRGKRFEPTPYHGYFYRLLTAQGEHAPGGARNYVNDGHMSGGFALLAYPAQYGESGIMTFMVNRSGIVFQKDLGEDMPTAAAAITEYNPDESW
jgi:hypothetical protein